MDETNNIPLVLMWKNVNGWTKSSRKSEGKKLLSDVSGMAKSGALTGVMSPSGAGKTTLLAILSRRYKGLAEGNIVLNGRTITQDQMSSISGYVCQKDQAYEDLTVKEHLIFMARFKMDKYSTAETRYKNILRVIDSLLLSHRLNVKISSLSGGQRKRLALAVQLLTQPKILFLDEPTTGLDSYNAERVVRLLRSLADDGMMVLCSIHQPASGIFEIFDDVTLLVSGGKLGYHGPVASIREFFASLGMKCPKNYNLCEYIVSQVTKRENDSEDLINKSSNIDVVVDAYFKSKIFQDFEATLEQILNNKINFSTRWSKRVALPLHVEIGWLCWRDLVLFRHTYKHFFLTVAAYLYVFSMISMPYGVIKNNQEGVQNMSGMLNTLIVQVFYFSLCSVLYVLPEELPIFVQEVADRLYSPSMFYFSKAFFVSVKVAIQVLFFTSYVLVITGLCATFTECLIASVPTVLLSLTAMAYGFFLTCAFRSLERYLVFSVPFEQISIVFAGLVLKLRSLPWHLAWIKYASFPYYAYEAESILQWGKRNHIYCDKSNAGLCYLNGDDVLISLGFSHYHLPMDFLGLIIYCVALHGLAFLFLLRKIKILVAY